MDSPGACRREEIGPVMPNPHLPQDLRGMVWCLFCLCSIIPAHSGLRERNGSSQVLALFLPDHSPPEQKGKKPNHDPKLTQHSWVQQRHIGIGHNILRYIGTKTQKRRFSRTGPVCGVRIHMTRNKINSVQKITAQAKQPYGPS